MRVSKVYTPLSRTPATPAGHFLRGGYDVTSMAIGKDPREWVVEIMGLFGSVVACVTAYSRGDLMLGIAGGLILILTLYVAQIRRVGAISVRDR